MLPFLSVHIKGMIAVGLFCIIPVICLYGQSNTPYPEGYLNDATRVDMSEAPDVFVTRGGNRVVTQVVNGRRWNRSWYWEQVRNRAPEMFDGNNHYLIDEGISPRANEQFIRHNPQFAKFRGEVLHHHHYLQGDIAYALPRKLHVGKGFTRLWHKFGGKTLLIFGSAFAVYQMAKAGNPFSESPFDPWVQVEALELELSLVEVAMSQGYSTIKRYIEQCKSCSELAICFVDYGELTYFLSKGKLPSREDEAWFFQQLPASGKEARYWLNKAVEFGIVFRVVNGAYESLGIIDLSTHE